MKTEIVLKMSLDNTEFTAIINEERQITMTLLEFIAIAGALERTKQEMMDEEPSKLIIEEIDGIEVK